jgi:hypothetical protein
LFQKQVLHTHNTAHNIELATTKKKNGSRGPKPKPTKQKTYQRQREGASNEADL